MASTLNEQRLSSLRRKFPALGRLERCGRRGRIPFVEALTPTDCGAACLTMTLGYYGKSIRLDEVRRQTGTARDGVSARSLANAAHNYGLRCRGVRIEVGDLKHLPAGSILHWNLNHFVVHEKAHRDGVDVYDPAAGRRRVTMDELGRSFTGVNSGSTVGMTRQASSPSPPEPREKRRLPVTPSTVSPRRSVPSAAALASR